MDFFVEQIRLVLPVLGYDVLRDKFVPPAHLGKEIMTESATARDIVPLRLKSSRRGLEAKAVERDGEILVLAGSLAEKNPDFAANQYASLRERLLKEKSLMPTEDGQFLRFAKDVLFSSPSAAAAVIYGRNANGRTSWTLANMNRTLKEHQLSKGAAE